MRYLVIGDAGHGLDTPGKRTPKFDDNTYMKENEFNRDVIRRIDNDLECYDNIDFVYTVTEKYDIPLTERVKRVNEYYNKYKNLYDKIVVVAVHANAMKDYWNDLGNGTATFHYPTNETDKKFAEVIQRNLIAKTGLKPHRGGVVAENFQIIRDVLCTACLCECAFMDNKEEAKLLMSDEFRQACAEGIVNGLKEYFGMNEKINVDYSVTKNGTYQLSGDVKDLGVKIVNKSNRSIQEPYCVNGTFFWTATPKEKYSTSILYANGKLYQAAANHLPCPQSVFIVYKDNTVEMKRIKNINELDLANVKLAIGGIGLINKLDSTFKYNPTVEGFKGAYSDVLRKTNKTVIGYNKSENKVYLMVRPNISHDSWIAYDLLDLVVDCEYDIALSVDGGGSTFFNNETDMVFKGDGRIIHNIIGFNLD